MARHQYHRRHDHRKNPLGVKLPKVHGGDILGLGLGAFAAPAVAGLFGPSWNTGWTGVAMTAVGGGILSIGVGYLGAGAEFAGEVFKGALLSAAIKAAHQAGIKGLGLGLYAPSWFGVPTASSQYLQASEANLGPYRRGQGTIFFPGPRAAVTGPSGQQYSPTALAMSGMGYHRFRSRYAGGYG